MPYKGVTDIVCIIKKKPDAQLSCYTFLCTSLVALLHIESIWWFFLFLQVLLTIKTCFQEGTN